MGPKYLLLNFKMEVGKLKLDNIFNQLVHPGFSKLGKAIETSNGTVAETFKKTGFCCEFGPSELPVRGT